MNAKLSRVLACAMAVLAIPAVAAQAQDAGAAASASVDAGANAGQDARASRQIVIYRCTDAAGRVTIQNDVACAKGAKQQRQVVDAPREERAPAAVATEPTNDAVDAMPGVPATAEPAAATATKPAPDAHATPLAPPPPLYACRTWDQRDFLTEDAKPAERCAPIPVVAIGGSRRSDATACEQVEDQCEAVPADALCAAWQRHVSEAEFRWKFADVRENDERRRDYERMKSALAQSTCAR